MAYAFGLDSIEELLNAAELDDDGEAEEVDDEKSTQSYPGGWSKPKMRRYAKALKPTARRVLRAIAKNAPSVDVDTVQSASGVDGYAYAGSMSSFGFAARNVWGVKEKPFTKVGHTYEMHPGVAKLAIAALDELGV